MINATAPAASGMLRLRSTNPDVYMTDLVVDDKTALATPDQFRRLMEYSTSMPTGKYDGKRWKRAIYKDRNYTVGGWQLGEYYETPELTVQGLIGIRWRDLQVVE